jgi:hypothetical protein
VAFDPLDPPEPITVVRRLLMGAMVLTGVGAVVTAIATWVVRWRLLALFGTLWSAWAFIEYVYERVLAPAGRFLMGQVFTGSEITLEEETAGLEARLAGKALPPWREILAGIRLAEIYRERLGDKPRADALLDRLMVKYPDSTELRIARRLPV